MYSSFSASQNDECAEEMRDGSSESSNNSVNLEPSAYELVREARMKEIAAAFAAAEEAGEFWVICYVSSMLFIYVCIVFYLLAIIYLL